MTKNFPHHWRHTSSIIKRKPHSQFGRHHWSQVLKAMTSYIFDIARFCLYPQELVLLMKEPIRVRKLQLLSHQFMICKCLLLLDGLMAWWFPLVNDMCLSMGACFMFDLRDPLPIRMFKVHVFCIFLQTGYYKCNACRPLLSICLIYLAPWDWLIHVWISNYGNCLIVLQPVKWRC